MALAHARSVSFGFIFLLAAGSLGLLLGTAVPTSRAQETEQAAPPRRAQGPFAIVVTTQGGGGKPPHAFVLDTTTGDVYEVREAASGVRHIGRSEPN